MSDTFDFGRFCKLLKYECVNYLPRYVKGMLVFAGFIVASWASTIFYGSSINDRTGDIFALVVFATLLSPYFVYGEINDRKKGYLYAMIPASNLEKLFSMMLVCMVAVPLFAYVALTATDVLLWLFSMIGVGGFNKIVFLNPAPIFDYGVLILFYIAAMSTVMMFNVLFRKHKIMKTVLFFIATFFVLVFGISLAVSVFERNFSSASAFHIWLGYNFSRHSLHETISLIEIILLSLNIAVACVTLFVTYRRIKRINY